MHTWSAEELWWWRIKFCFKHDPVRSWLSSGEIYFILPPITKQKSCQTQENQQSKIKILSVLGVVRIDHYTRFGAIPSRHSQDNARKPGRWTDTGNGWTDDHMGLGMTLKYKYLLHLMFEVQKITCDYIIYKINKFTEQNDDQTMNYLLTSFSDWKYLYIWSI